MIIIFQITKSSYTIVLAMDFLVIFQKVVIIPMLQIYKIFVPSLRVNSHPYDSSSFPTINHRSWMEQRKIFIYCSQLWRTVVHGGKQSIIRLSKNILIRQYAAAYPEEISCLVALDSIIANERTTKPFWQHAATRIERTLQYYSKTPKIHKGDLTYEKAIELQVKFVGMNDCYVFLIRVRSSRLGIDDQAAKLLVERSIRRDQSQLFQLFLQIR